MRSGKKLLYNATFVTMEGEGLYASGMLISDGRIQAVYPTPESIPSGLFSSGDVERTDLGWAAVVPGFIDTHTHAYEGGMYSLGTDLSGARRLDEVFTLLKNSEPVNGKILAWRFEEAAVAEKRFPTIEELDRVQPSVPLLLRRVDGHSAMVNSAAAKKIPWSEKVDPSVPLRGEANHEASQWFHENIGEAGVLQAYQAAAEEAIGYGVTTVHAMVGDGKGDPRHFEIVRDAEAHFPVEFVLYPQITDVRRALELGSPRIGGCILADGSLGSHTAALLAPYTDRPGWRGALYKSDEFWHSFVHEAHAAGLQIAVHAIGDAAVSQILGAYLSVQRKSPKPLRHQIIHNLLTDDPILDGMAEAGAVAVMQPMFDRLWGGADGYYAQVLGPERVLRTNRFSSILDRGILLTGGSDWYITTLDALAGMNAAARLRNPAERVGAWQALQMYTSSAAKLSGDGDRLGKLLPGYQADLVVLEQNPLVDTAFDAVKILRVMKRGEFVKSG